MSTRTPGMLRASVLRSYRGLWRDWLAASDHVDAVEQVMALDFANMARPWRMPWAAPRPCRLCRVR